MPNDFREKVYAMARQIPSGKVVSYGQLALLCGKPRAARLVGTAMRTCPEGSGVPCHRVLHADGSLAHEDAFGVWGLQRELLYSEGVSFLDDGRVNMARNRWDGQPV